MDQAIRPGSSPETHRNQKSKKFWKVSSQFGSTKGFFESKGQTLIAAGLLENFKTIWALCGDSTRALDPSRFTTYICNASAGRRRGSSFRTSPAGPRGHKHH